MKELFSDDEHGTVWRIRLPNNFDDLNMLIGSPDRERIPPQPPKYSEADHIRAERMARVMAMADAEDPDVTVAPHRVMQLTKRGNTVIPDNCVKLWQTYLGIAYALIDDERG